MKLFSYLIVVIAVLGITFAGCSKQGDPILPDYPEGDPAAMGVTASLAGNTSIVINGYLVQFDGRTYANDLTTFSYTVTGTGGEHALSFFLLELPDCAPALDSFSPGGATIGIDPHTGIYGIKWGLSLGPNESRSYSITFPGDIPLGIIFSSVKASTIVETGEVAGPCKGFEISGTVYVDADESGTMNETDESGIVDVTVTLVDGNGDIQTAVTDENGYYMFFKSAGTYTVRIDAETAADDFNESLAASFDPTGPMSLIVTVGPDSPGNNFGFYPRAEEITFEIEQGALLTSGEQPKFWIRQLRTAMKGGKGQAEFDAETMAQFIAEIQGLFLPDPFQFTPGNEFQEALDILSIKSKDPVQNLIRELLAAEFNEVSGKGLVDAPALQSVLLAWVESVIVEATAPASSMLESSDRPLLGQGIDDRVADAYSLLVQLNGTTGGGSGGGG